jgi:murein DD-endopeptidase MepM/ murein hydrolase activator NlpD
MKRKRTDPYLFLHPVSGFTSSSPRRRPSRRRAKKKNLRALGILLPFVLIALVYVLFHRRGPVVEHEPSQVPAEEELLSAPGPTVVENVILPGETLSDILGDNGLSPAEIHKLVEEVKPVFDLAKIRAGRPMKIAVDADGGLQSLDYSLDEEEYLLVTRNQTGYAAERRAYAFETRIAYVDGVITDHLYGAIMAGGEEAGLAVELDQIFGWDIDFYAGIRTGDAFRLIVEKRYLDGRFQKYGDILAAEFWNDGRRVEAYRFEHEEDGTTKSGYYHPDGRSLRKEFLKVPLDSYRITSRFTSRRLHPIRKVYRAHYGVDYAAPIGSPVYATAAGTVTQAGSNGAAGRMITIKHPNGYETMYLHLNSILVRKGQKVEMKQRIGTVGRSGEATGPHLDYRIKRFGSYLNPLSAKFEPVEPLASALLPAFQKRAAALRAALDAPVNIIRRESVFP